MLNKKFWEDRNLSIVFKNDKFILAEWFRNLKIGWQILGLKIIAIGSIFQPFASIKEATVEKEKEMMRKCVEKFCWLF